MQNVSSPHLLDFDRDSKYFKLSSALFIAYHYNIIRVLMPKLLYFYNDGPRSGPNFCRLNLSLEIFTRQFIRRFEHKLILYR